MTLGVHLIVAFVVGALVAFIASIPVGGVNMAIVQATINSGRKSGFMIAVGATFIEMIYASIPLFGMSFMTEDSFLFHAMYLFSVPILLGIGIYTIITRKIAAIKSARLKTQQKGGFFYGAMLCATNPMVFIFWSQVIVVLANLEILTNKPAILISFFIGIPVGLMGLFIGLIAIAHSKRKQVTLRTKARFNLAVGIIFIGLSIYIGLNYLHKIGMI